MRSHSNSTTTQRNTKQKKHEVLAAAPLFAGCVMQSTFDAKQAELDQLKADDAKRDAEQKQKIAELQSEIDKLQ